MLISSSLSWPPGPEVVEVYFIKIVILTTRLCREGALCNITLMYYIYMCLFDEFGLSNEGEMGRLNANKQQKEAKQCFWTCRLCSSQQQTPPPLVAWRRSSPTGGLAVERVSLECGGECRWSWSWSFFIHSRFLMAALNILPERWGNVCHWAGIRHSAGAHALTVVINEQFL